MLNVSGIRLMITGYITAKPVKNIIFFDIVFLIIRLVNINSRLADARIISSGIVYISIVFRLIDRKPITRAAEDTSKTMPGMILCHNPFIPFLKCGAVAVGDIVVLT
jgi:hypothetical protein